MKSNNKISMSEGRTLTVHGGAYHSLLGMTISTPSAYWTEWPQCALAIKSQYIDTFTLQRNYALDTP
jgi:hypothetical protein